MVITREQLIKKLAEETGFWQKDMRTVFSVLDKVIMDCFAQATEDEPVAVQLFEGCKIGCKIVPERIRVKPDTQEKVVCKPTVKPNAKFSDRFRELIQQNYDNKMGQ